MAKTVRDILVNVDSGDLLLSAGDMGSHMFFNIVWGSLFDGDNANTLYANVIIPSRKLSKLVADEQGRYLLYAKATYYPYNQPFQVRLVSDNNGTYEQIEQANCRFPVISLAYLPGDTLMTVNASELPYINIDGNYLFKLEFGSNNSNKAYVYTADNTDMLIGDSDLQSSQLLSICEPGKFYRYPTTGIGVTKFIGSVVSHTELGDKIIEQFENNGISVQDANFDTRTGELQVIFFNEGIEEDLGLLDVADLNISEIDVTDADLADIASEINLDDYDVNYDTLSFDIDAPDASLESCFANGIWIGAYPWTGAELWKGHE